MGSIEDLASALYSDQIQKQIAAENSYYNLQQVPDAVSGLLTQAAVKNPGQFSTKDLIVGALLSGGASGLLGGFGDKYQSTLTNRYQDVLGGAMRGSTPAESSSGLSPSLFRGASNAGSIFRIKQALANDQAQTDLQNDIKKASVIEGVKAEADSKKELVKQFIDNPRKASRGMAAYLAAVNGTAPIATKATESAMVTPIAPDGIPSDIATPLPEMPEAALPQQPATNPDLNQFGFESLDSRRQKKFLQYIDAGLPDVQAATAAQNDLKAELEADKNSYQRIDEARQKAKTLHGLADTTEGVLSQGLKTGAGAGVGQTVAEWNHYIPFAQTLGFDDARASAGQSLNSIKAQLMGINRVVGSGSTSDYEARQYMAAGPGMDKTVDANLEIVNRMRQVANRNQDYADFVDEVRNSGGTIRQADQLWSKYERANPLWATIDGKKVPNPNIVPPSQFDFLSGTSKSDGAAPDGSGSSQGGPLAPPVTQSKAPPAADSAMKQVGQVAGEFIGGVGDLPQVVAGAVNPATYKEAFSTPEKGLETVGRGAAMTAGTLAGAGTGAAIGTAVLPVIGTAAGALLGGAIGAGAGYLGFNSAEEAASELVGAGTDKTVVPSMQDVKDAARVGGQSLGIGLLTKGVGTAAKGVSKLTSGANNAAKGAVAAAEENIVGIRPGNIETVLKENKFKFFDDTGNEVPVANATDYKTGLEQSLEVLKKDGFLDELTNNPRTAKLVYEQKSAAAGQEIKDLHIEASKALQQIYDDLTPIQKKQFPLTRDPATGKGGFNPDFSAAYDKVSGFGRTDPQLVKPLKMRLDEIINRYDKSPKSYQTLQTYKEDFGGATKWKPATTEVANAWNDVKKLVYSAFNKEQSRAFDYAMSKTNPEQVGALKDANVVYHSYKNVEPILDKMVSKGRAKLKIGTLGSALPGSLMDRSPATTLGAARKIAGATGTASKTAQSFSDLINSEMSGQVAQAAQIGLPALQGDTEDAQAMELPSRAGPSLFKPSVAGSLFRVPEDKKKMNEFPKTDIKAVEAQIDSDPIDSAIYQAESNRDPKAKNKVSSASGGFQLTSKTAKDLGVKDVFDLAQNYDGYKKLRAENQARFGSDPAMLYSAHYLGATVLAKVLEKKPLTKDEQAQVEYLKNKALPDFMKIYQSKIGSDYSEA